MKVGPDSPYAGAPAGHEGKATHERSSHRLEAFSDIVIGFSLAQLGLTLVIPAHAIEFVTRPVGIFAFVITFVTVVRFWWVNFFVFEHYFRPNRVMVGLNFVALGSLILQVFSLQLYLHFGPLEEGAVASRIYFAFFALSYGMQGIMLTLGLRYRWGELSPGKRRAAVRVLLGRAGIVVGSVIGNMLANNELASITVNVAKQSTVVAHLPFVLFADTFLGALVGALASCHASSARLRHDARSRTDPGRAVSKLANQERRAADCRHRAP